MSRAVAAHHGPFGRACLYEMDRPMATHAHHEGHLVFHIDGPEAQFDVSGVPYTVTASKGVAVSSLQPHSFKPGKGGLGQFLVLYINPSWFGEHCETTAGALTFGSNVIHLDALVRQCIGSIVERLTDTGASCGSIDSQLRKLTQSCRAQSWQHAAPAAGMKACVSTISDHRIRRSIAHLRHITPDGDASLDAVAANVGLSRPHFYRLFRENTGITPNVYMNILRMEVAIDRLVTTDHPVTSIGLDLGFASQASFTRFFGANVGIPPTDYRRAAQLA